MLMEARAALRIQPSIKPRKWQKRALELWVGEMRGIAQVVTGGGKTVFAYLCIDEFFQKFQEGRVFIIVPTIALLDQWFVDVTATMDLRAQPETN